MKRNDWVNLKKRALVAVCMVCIGAVFAFVLRDFIGQEASLWQRGIYCVSVVGTILCGFLYLFYCWHAFWIGCADVFLLFLCDALPQYLPQPWKTVVGIVFLALGVAFILLIVLWDIGTLKRQKPAIRAMPQDTILVRFHHNGDCYQLFREQESIIAYHLDADLNGLQDAKFPLRPPGSKDYVFSVKDGLQVSVSETYNEWLDCLELVFTLHSGGNTYMMHAEAPTSDQALQDFYAREA